MSRAFIQKRLPFKPTDIGGCQLWLDGVDSTKITLTSGSNISTWIDKSSLANNFTNTNTTPPTKTITPGGYPCVYLNGSTCQMTSVSNNSTSGNSSRTVIMISQTGAGGDSRFGTGPHGGASPPNTYGIDLAPVANIIFCPYVYTGSDVTAYGVPNTNMYSLYSYYDSSTSTVGGIVNFTLTASKSTTLNTSATPWYLGLRPDGGHSIAAYVCEIIHYNSILTTPQREQVESYLAQKWGLRQQLPQGHPGTRGIVYPSDPVNLLVRVPYPFVFTPSAVGTVSMWLDGADPAGTGTPPSNGATVSTWVDKSGSGINLTAVGTPTYTLSNSSVYLDGSAYLQNTNFNFTNYTLFIVSVQTSDIGPLYTNNTTTAGYSGFFPIYYSGYYLVQSDGSWLTSTSAFSKGTTYIYSIQYDSLNNINVWSTGSISPVITGTAGTITRNKFLLGKQNVGQFSENMTGNIFEIIQYNSDLGQSSRQQVEGYLAWKWGLQANLPANHPYKNASPNITNQFGISRPNVFPIPPITISARARPTFPFTNTFTYSAAGNQTFQVPATISPATITVYMWGAGAGGNTNYGGAGAMVQGVLTVIPGETLTIVVGQGGTIDGLNTFGGGGAGGGNFTGISPAVGIGYSFNGFPQNAGSGGGRSAIQRGGTDPLNDIVVAGGGGGGSYFSSDHGGAATFSGTANPGTGGLPGLGGTQSAGGAGGGVGTYGTGLTGSRGLGGDTYNNNIFNGGGGGGGGYYGGGGGGTNGGDGAGGGGGSSLTDGLSLIPGQTVKGFNSANGFTAPNTASPYYQSGIGNGAPAVNSSPRAGGNGLIVLIYYA